jgi:two-component system sensor histidine kinase PilS (NtrC family)
MAGAHQQPWLDLRLGQDSAALQDNPDEFARLWRGFMTARVTLGLVLLALQSTLYVLDQASSALLVLVCGAYLVATLATRLLGQARRLGPALGPQWVATIGVDVITFALLQYVQGHAGINYSPLLALPVLLAAVLGSLSLAMGTAAGATLLLLAQAWLTGWRSDVDSTSVVAQAALTGAGYFVIAFLASQMSARLATEEQRSRRSQMLARVQRQVNALVIEAMTDGILVVDAHDMVLAANPAACKLLGREGGTASVPFSLTQEPAWRELAQVNQSSFAGNRMHSANIVLTLAGSGQQHAHVRSRIAATDDDVPERLCVMFVQDQREVEARMRTEKLVSMGRMSAAVAHEIRNPLAAIVQANALLDEEVVDPALKSLIRMVHQNANRLERIVDEVLNISRLQRSGGEVESSRVRLDSAVAQICMDWSQHTGRESSVSTELRAGAHDVAFDVEHLRRVLVNLLDNARRYAGSGTESIQVSTGLGPGGQLSLAVWSDGLPMEPSVERHLFEPFFSSESRSTGLGLYICRELCVGHGSVIGFARAQRKIRGAAVDGNEFRIGFASALSDKIRP